MERKPVLFTVGSPLTVVKRADSSDEKKVCETVFSGPTGGVLCPRSKDRSSSICPSPCREKEAHEIPALAPVVPTQASLFFADAATVFGNSPGMAKGLPTHESDVASLDDMVIMVRVLEPAFTANRF